MYQETPLLNLDKYNRKASQKTRQKKSSDGAKGWPGLSLPMLTYGYKLVEDIGYEKPANIQLIWKINEAAVYVVSLLAFPNPLFSFFVHKLVLNK